MRRWRFLAALALAEPRDLLPATARGQGPGLFIDIQPAAGPPGSTVTIIGHGVVRATRSTSPGSVAGYLYFAATAHNVCNQQRGLGFLNTWRSNGRLFDGRPDATYAERLTLFGAPITEPSQLTFPDGRTLQVQWFEQARLEWHSGNPARYRALPGRLGAEVLAGQAAAAGGRIS